MGLKLKIIIPVISATIAVLVVWQFVSFWTMASSAKYRTLDRLLPQHTHFKGTAFHFACISDSVLDSLTVANRLTIEETLSPYFEIVYFGEDAIPDDMKIENINIRTGKKKISSLNGGCILKFEVRESGLMWFKGYYSDYVALLAASGHEATLVWILGKWWFVSVRQTWIS